MDTNASPSQTESGDDSVDKVQRLQAKLRQLRADFNDLAEEYDKLVEENHDNIDTNNANVDLVRKKIQKLKLSREKQQQAFQERDDLEQELDELKKSHRRKLYTKSQIIRKMVEERGEFQIMLSKKHHQVEKVRDLLNDRNFEAKQSIATTTRLDKQIGDEAFRKSMDQMFERFRDCFMGVRRKQSFDVKENLSDDVLGCFLAKSVPRCKDNTPEDKLHVCIALVSRVLTEFVNKKFAFGVSTREPILSAWHAWQGLKEGVQNLKSRREIKRWLALTSNVLTDSHRDLMVQAREESLELILEDMKKDLEAVTTLEFTDAIRRRLSDAISPHLTTLRLLHFQEWEYRFIMLPAGRNGDPVRFSRISMEGLFSEETGFVQASLFPQLCRLEEGDEDEDEGYTVICKARVAVTPENFDTDDDTGTAQNVEETAESTRSSVVETTESPREMQRESLERMSEFDMGMADNADEPMEDSLVASDTTVDVNASTEEDTMMVIKQEFTAEFDVEVDVKVEMRVEESDSERVVQDSFDEAEIEGMDESG